MDSNMYRVGDQVYFEISQSPIRRIEELIKQANDQVEAKVTCFFRRRDISNSLITLADKHNIALEEEEELEAESLNEKQKHQLKHRELFFSRQVGTLSSTQIRGKCNVSLLNELESLSSYLSKDDSFFYTLVYEPSQKTLLADRGEIRVGQRYQAEVPQKMPEQPELDLNKRYETLVFTPDNKLTDAEIEQYITIVKSIGIFGRGLDINSSIKAPNLTLTAALSSQDVTIQKAMDVLHENNYDIVKALFSLTSSGSATICKDELQEWSPAESSKFHNMLELKLNKYYETLVFTNDDRLMETEINHYLTIVKLFGDICLLQNKSTNETKSDDGFEFMRASSSFNVSFSSSESNHRKRKKYEHSLSTINHSILDDLDQSSCLNSLLNNEDVLEKVKFNISLTHELKVKINECLSICYDSHGFPSANSNEMLLSCYVFLILGHIVTDFNKRFRTDAYVYSQNEIINSNKLYGGSFDFAITDSKSKYKVGETIIFFECKLKCIYEALNQCRGYLKIAAESDSDKVRYAIGLTGSNWILLKYEKDGRQNLYQAGLFLNPSLIANKRMFLGNSIFVDFIYQILSDHYRISLDS